MAIKHVNKIGKIISKITPELKRIDSKVSSRVGQFIVKFSYQEWLLSIIVYAALGVNHRQGRIAVRDPRMEDSFDMLVTLCRFAKIELPTTFAATKKLAKAMDEKRNLLAHGLWKESPTAPFLTIRQVSGTWQPNGKDRISRRVMPEPIPMSSQILDAWLVDMSRLIRETEAIQRCVVRQLLALQKKQTLQSA